MTALAKIDGAQSVLAGLIPRTIEETLRMSEMLAKSELVPDAYRGKQANIFQAILYGLEVGLPPIAALRCLNVIKGKVVPYADTLVAIVLGSGKCKYFRRVSSSDTEATYETLRVGDAEPRRETFTIDDAKRAGLLDQNQNYKKYPRKMLEPRAKAFLCRDVYPDVCAGIQTAEEVIDMAEDETGVYRQVADASKFSDPAKAEAKPTAAPELPPAPPSLQDIKAALEDPDLHQKVYDHVIVRMAEIRDQELYDELRPELNALPKGTRIREIAMQIRSMHAPHLGNEEECHCVGWAVNHLVPLLRGDR